MKGRLGNSQRLGHAIDGIEEIERYVDDHSFSDFLANSMMQFACIKQLELIGEACNHVDSLTQQEYPEVEWRQIVGLRTLLIHEYFGVDSTLIWDIIQTNLPALKSQLKSIVDNE